MSGPAGTREAVLDYIVQFKRRHNGIAPSVREIGAAVGLSTTSSVTYHLDKLASDGRILFPLGRGVQRAIGVPGYEYTEVTGGAS